MMCLVSAIVLAFGDKPALWECLRALDDALDRVPGTSELIVVVNQLPATGHAELQTRHPCALRVDPGCNLGFAGGVTAGLEVATGDWIALVNDDCIVESTAVAELIRVARSAEDLGSVAARVRFATRPETINSTGIELDRLAVARERLLGQEVDGQASKPTEVFGPSGTFALYRRAMLDELGGFDASFFAYLEDADLAWRARMAGWRCLYAPNAVALHRHSASFGHASAAKHFLVGRNRVRMIAKNDTTRHLRRWALSMILYDCAYAAYALFRDRTLAALRGRLQGLREWRRYRMLGAPSRRPVDFAESTGLAGALRRDRSYRDVRAAGAHRRRH